jgi:hypothetical protein
MSWRWLIVLAVVGCGGTRKDESLAVLEVSAAGDVPAFTTLRFSVPARPEIGAHQIPGARRLKFGYYLPGPDGPLVVRAEALAEACVVGAGNAQVTVSLGRVLDPVPLTLAGADDPCPPPDGGGVDAPLPPDAPVPSDAVIRDGAVDAPALDSGPDSTLDSGPRSTPDARPDSSPDSPPPPMCLAAVAPCSASTTCCPGLACSTNSRGLVCCANFGAACKNSLECCGDFDCINGGCCLQPLTKCQNGGCCAGLECGMTTAGRVCCGRAGTPCNTVNGSDCCDLLRCDQATHRCAP